MRTKFVLVFALIVCVLNGLGEAQRPAHCLQPHPQGVGRCDMLISGFFYNSERNECEQWTEEGCRVQGGHTYDFKEDCVNECIEIN
ncbi:kunitz-type serine protease inhibitor homolog dendrotoxin I-like [Ceratitis capitata]|uniref:kunitz-type serine protease inhibitor homolog dendrotoxin I-like n=1 Tax=Ceratitis capitata TaxID=7213 RepID=UPI000329D063|nr:kunitz-type serine protease inhibitor homolog dendrotoxin I-like [Ceratitis capitata]